MKLDPVSQVDLYKELESAAGTIGYKIFLLFFSGFVFLGGFFTVFFEPLYGLGMLAVSTIFIWWVISDFLSTLRRLRDLKNQIKTMKKVN